MADQAGNCVGSQPPDFDSDYDGVFRFYENQAFRDFETDLVINSSGTLFQVHSFILCASSDWWMDHIIQVFVSPPFQILYQAGSHPPHVSH
jgi:hypothetical protein